MNLKIVFLGTPEFGANVLSWLIKNNLKPILVISQPDRKQNRKKQVVFSPVKTLALEHHLNLIQPEKIKQAQAVIAALQPDLMLTAAYGQFVPESVLNLFPMGAWNVHGSLLPQLRGGAPIHWAIINGAKVTGVSLMKMVKQMDAGDYIGQISCPISNEDTYQSVHNKLLTCTNTLLDQYFHQIITKTYHAVVQDNDQVTFGYNIQTSDQYINWNASDQAIFNLIRGLNDHPVAKTIHCNTTIKVYAAELSEHTNDQMNPGTIISIDHNGIGVVCGNHKIIYLTTIQLPNKKACLVSQLIHGNLIIKLHEQFTNYETN